MSKFAARLERRAHLALDLTSADIEAVLAPLIEGRFQADDPEWKAIRKRVKHKHRRLMRRHVEAPGFTRTVAHVDSTYADVWSSSLKELLHHGRRPVPYEWRGEGLLLQPQARRRLNHVLLRRALAAIDAQRVLEVGAGNGFNLFLLAAQAPHLDLTGLELTAAGLAAAQAIARKPELPRLIADASAAPIVDRTAHRHVRLVRGTAAALPFPDQSFDAVCTVLALEQMEQIAAQAFAELRRVTRRWVVMIEPFRDLNARGICRDYVESRDYLSESMDGLTRHGLRPRAAFIDIPNKLQLHVGLVVAERR